MPPRKNAAAPSATATAKPSAADFFKPAKPSTSLRTTPLKKPNQKSLPVFVQPAVDRRHPSVPAAATPATRKPPPPDTDKEDDDFGEDLDLLEVLSDDDNFFGDLKDRTVQDKSPSFKDVGSIAKADLKTGTHLTDVNEMLLRQFDLTSKYGPCLGMTRLERWERASLLDLDPPKEIKDLLEKTKNHNTPLFATHV